MKKAVIVDKLVVYCPVGCLSSDDLIFVHTGAQELLSLQASVWTSPELTFESHVFWYFTLSWPTGLGVTHTWVPPPVGY